LSPAVGQQPVPTCYAPCDDKRQPRRFAFGDYIRAGSEAFFAPADRLQKADIAVRERGEKRKLGYQRVWGEFMVAGHDAFNSGSSLIQARRFWLGNVFADALQLAPYRA
jgi:hypothetical protein